jgi:hypothetical protein
MTIQNSTRNNVFLSCIQLTLFAANKVIGVGCNQVLGSPQKYAIKCMGLNRAKDYLDLICYPLNHEARGYSDHLHPMYFQEL